MSAGENKCQLGGSEDTERHLPWANDQRGDYKTKLFEYAREHTDGALFAEAFKSVFNKESTTGDADYKLTDRFYCSYDEYFKIDRRDGHKWVEPRPAAFHLTTSKHSPKPQYDGEEAKSNVLNSLKRRRMIKSDKARGHLLGGLGAKIETTEHKWLILEGRECQRDYMLMPFQNLYNSSNRVDGAIARYRRAWSTAAAEYDRGVLLTLTTDPSRYDSIADATEGLMDDLNRLKSWLANRFFDGRRPPHIAVPEFTESGLPHLHVAIFGIDYIPQAVLAHYWDRRRDRGSNVWLRGMKVRGARWHWQSRPKLTKTRPPQAYLAKGLYRLKSLSAADADCVKQAADRLRSGRTREDDEAHEWWRLAVRWALDVKLFTCSPSLKQGYDQGTSREPERAPQWRFIGASGSDTIPGHVWREGFSRGQ